VGSLKFLVLLIDDILIYSYEGDHECHLSLVLETLKKREKIDKCEFRLSKVDCLGHLCAHTRWEGYFLCIYPAEKEHEQNYLTLDIELVLVVCALKIWTHYRYGIL
jgi:hypothetical protein